MRAVRHVPNNDDVHGKGHDGDDDDGDDDVDDGDDGGGGDDDGTNAQVSILTYRVRQLSLIHI